MCPHAPIIKAGFLDHLLHLFLAPTARLHSRPFLRLVEPETLRCRWRRRFSTCLRRCSLQQPRRHCHRRRFLVVFIIHDRFVTAYCLGCIQNCWLLFLRLLPSCPFLPFLASCLCFNLSRMTTSPFNWFGSATSSSPHLLAVDITSAAENLLHKSPITPRCSTLTWFSNVTMDTASSRIQTL